CDSQRRQQGAGVVERSLPEREELDPATAVRRRIIVLQPFRRGGNFFLRLGQGHAGLETREAFDPPRTPVFDFVPGTIEFLLHRRWNPKVKSVAHEGSIKSFGRDADDGEGNAVEPLCLPHDFRIAAKAVSPQLIADDDYGMSVAPDSFLRPEAAPERRTH